MEKRSLLSLTKYFSISFPINVSVKKLLFSIMALFVCSTVLTAFATTCDLDGLTFEIPDSFISFNEDEDYSAYISILKGAMIITGSLDSGGVSFDDMDYSLITEEVASDETVFNLDTNRSVNGIRFASADLNDEESHIQGKMAIFLDDDKVYIIMYTKQSDIKDSDISDFESILQTVQLNSFEGREIGSALEKAETDTYNTLQKGDSGSDVKKMQKRLVKLGYLDKTTVDGIFSDEEETAVKLFQATVGYDSTGIADEDTLTALYDKTAPRAPKYKTLQKGDKSDDVKKLQQRLIDLNYLDGKADGDFGNMTKQAVERFQAAVNQQVSGIANEATQKALYAEDAPKAKTYKKLDFKKLSRDPDVYSGEYYSFTGKVIQVLESTNWDGTTSIQMRIATKSWYDDVVMVTYTRKKGESRILEDDKVTVYGQFDGLLTYAAIMGNEVTVPLFVGEQVTVQ